MSVRFTVLAAAISSIFACGAALAQQAAPIERIKMTDGQLSCSQLFGEAGDMDKAMAEAREAESSGNTTATAGSAANTAAEVAGRTGLFSSFGIAGHFFGQAATQAAAGVARSSGQMSAAQAAERIKQASARKEHLTTLFVAKGCNPSNLDYNPPATDQSSEAVKAALKASAAAAAPVAPKTVDPAVTAKLFAPLESVTALPDIDPDQHFKGQMGGTFGKNVVDVLPNSRRVAVMGFRVVFVTENTATAQVRASYFLGRDTSGARSTLNVKLAGVDKATMQAVTDKAYADFLQQLKFAGREVVPQEELKEFFSGVDAAAERPFAVSKNGQSAQVFSPTGMPLWFFHGEQQWGDRGIFDQKNHRFMSEYSARVKAISIAPTIVVNFAHMSSSGNRSGILARSAETGAELGMHVAALSSVYVRSDETRGGIVMSGDDGSLQMQAPFVSDAKFGAMKEVAQSDNSAAKGVFDALGKGMGMLNAGGAAVSKSESVAETTGADYGAAAVGVLGLATGTFARWFQKYPAK